jgi:dipeptidyl aminopeptidase/acylaminoacyl peptidase
MSKRSWLTNTSLLFSALVSLGAYVLAQDKTPEVRRPITVEDGIETNLIQVHQEAPDLTKLHPAWFSPDGKRFVVSLKEGNLKQNTNDTTLLLFRTADAVYAPKPETLITMSSSLDREGIRELRWVNNTTLAFLGEKPRETPQIYTLDVTTKHLERLTSQTKQITRFDITPDRDEIIYKMQLPFEKRPPESAVATGAVTITQQHNLSLLLRGEYTPYLFDAQLFVQKRNHSPLAVHVNDPPINGTLALSPDGRHALVLQVLWGHDLKKVWADYDFGQQDEYLHGFFARSAATEMTPFMQFQLVDTKTGSLSPLLNSLFFLHGSPPFAVWKPDGKSVWVSDQYLPLDVADPAERQERIKNRYDVEVNVLSKEYRKVSKEEVPEQETVDLPIDVTVDEDINTPPRLNVVELKTKQRTTLLDPNPQYSALSFGKVETIQWKVAQDYEVLGGLYLPPDYVAGKKYPLVIQTHGYNSESFSMDGKFDWNSGYAARALAARGVVVLQAYRYAKENGADSGRVAADRKLGATAVQAWKTFETLVYEGAIDYLDKQGLVDRDRVGIMGFSRTVCYVGYTLTHSKYRFAAALLVDGFDCGYFQYIAYGASPDEEQLNGGGPPFGESLAEWVKEAPGFNLDKVQAPVRLEAHGGRDAGGVMEQWEWFKGLSRLRKPVEYILLPEAAHMIAQPRERMISQQGAVDWFCFWLKGEEDADPAKHERYLRWREMRGK